MTFCLGIRCREGLLALADTRINAGTEIRRAKKASVHTVGTGNVVLLTSGLRSVRDALVGYIEGPTRHPLAPPRLTDFVKETAAELRRIRVQEESALTAGNLRFDLHTIIGGQLAADPEPALYLLYPETNWVEVTEEMPYISIGVTGYAKPILDALCHYEMTLGEALRAAVLAADATINSVSDVGYPLDCVLYDLASNRMSETRFEAADVKSFTDYWSGALKRIFSEGALHADPLFARLTSATDRLDAPAPVAGPARRSA